MNSSVLRYNKWLLWLLCWSGAFFPLRLLTAQPIGKMTRPIQRALNNYIVQGNETAHVFNFLQYEFVHFNEQFNAYLEADASARPLPSLPHSAFVPYTEIEDLIVQPLPQLYQHILDDNIQLPAAQRKEILSLSDKRSELLRQLENRRRALYLYVQRKEYESDDARLSRAYTLLAEVEVMYYDLFTLQEKIHYACAELSAMYERTNISAKNAQTLSRMSALVAAAQSINKTIRSGNLSKTLRADCQKMSEILAELQDRRSLYLSELPRVDSSLFCPHKQYDVFTKRGQDFLFIGLEYLNQGAKKYENRPLPAEYFFYNFELFARFNRYGDGLVVLLNRMIDRSGEYYLYAPEMPLFFSPAYPNIPAYDSLRFRQKGSTDVDEFVRRLEQHRLDSMRLDSNLRDSLRQDSIKRANPQVGDPSLEGFATNNLIFVLDFSLSMNHPSKLPAMKSAIAALMELMREEDHITVIAYAKEARLIVPPTSARYKDEILQHISLLETSTTTNADAGLSLAYENAQRYFIPNGNNRILIATDDVCKLSSKTRRQMRQATRRNIRLSVFYFSEKEYSEKRENLQKLSREGGGNYHFAQPENIDNALRREAQALRR